MAAEQHRLTGRETLALVAAFKAAEDEGQRRALLAAPLAWVRPSQQGPSLGSLATRLAERLERIRAALLEAVAKLIRVSE